MRATKRIVAGLAACAMLALAFVPAGASSPKATHHQPAVLERSLAAKVLHAKPTQVFETIVSAWDRKALRTLDRMRVRNRKLSVLPMAFAKLTPLQITRLLTTDGVRSIYGQRRLQLSLQESTHLIHAREAAEKLGVDGTGATVAVIDTGVDALHPDLTYGEKVIHNYEVLAPGIFDPEEPLLVDDPNTDDDGHGTHVSGTIAGTGSSSPEGQDLAGVAPGAKLVVYSANQGPSLLVTHTVAAFDHILATASESHVRAVSNSWGGGDGFDHDPNDPNSIAIEVLYKHGILAVFAAGNSGTDDDTTPDGSNTLGSECVSPFAVCVAAATKHSQVATFSSRGRPTGNQDRALALKYNLGVYRPTVTAPGVDIVAPAALSAAPDDQNPPWGYMSISGTSMSTPMVTGVVALMAAANPKLTPAQIVQILEGTADALPGWDAFEAGAGMVNARRAVEAALALKAGRTPALVPPRFDYAPPARVEKTLSTLEGATIPAQFAHKVGVETQEFTVPSGVERLQIDLTWSTPAENLYGFLWGPGQTPNDANPQAAPYPVQEAWGLLCEQADLTSGPCTLTRRELVVTYPQPGTWKLRVYARTAGLSYQVVVKALTFALPKLDLTSTGAVIAGVASFPKVDLASRDLPAVAGTPPRNPTLAERVVYFHGSGPVGNLDVASGTDPSWDYDPPTGGNPKASNGFGGLNNEANGNAPILPRFSKTLDRAIEGDVIVSFWASTQTALQSWGVAILSGDEGENVVATASATRVAAPTAPGLVVVVVRNVRIPAKTKMIIQISDVLSPHYAVLYDSAEMQSGMILPEVSRPFGAAGTDAPTSLIAKDLRNGSIELEWARSAGVASYRIYGGIDLSALRLIRKVPDKAAPAKPQSPFTAEGVIEVGNPGTQFGAGVTEDEFILGCSAEGSAQGLDGYVIKLPDGVGDGLQQVSVTSDAALHDLDLEFYNEDCSENVGDIATEAPDEQGTVPKGAAWLVVNLWDGAHVSFKAVVTRPSAGASASIVITGAGLNRAMYFRVAAVDRKGNEGPASDLLTIRPTAFTRGIEVSTDGSTWALVPSDLAAKATEARFSVAGSTAARAAGITRPGSHMVWIRARAGDVTTKPVQVHVLASGAVQPATEPGLPATGVARYGVIALALIIGGAAVALYLRRAR